MPLLRFETIEIEIPRNIALLDTNVLVAYFDDRDSNHEAALLLLDDVSDYIWLLTSPVITEAAGMLSRRRDNVSVVRLLAWAISLNNSIILPSSHIVQPPEIPLRSAADVMTNHSVDFVDSYLMDLAHVISDQLGLVPDTPIATFDKRDFFRCAGKGLKYSIYSTDDFELIRF